jgi:hypothetical protein
MNFDFFTSISRLASLVASMSVSMLFCSICVISQQIHIKIISQNLMCPIQFQSRVRLILFNLTILMIFGLRVQIMNVRNNVST